MSDLSLQFKAPQTARPARQTLPFGRILVNAGIISQTNLVRALEQQSRLGIPLGEILLADGLVTRAQITAALAEQFQIQRVDLTVTPSDRTLARHLKALDCLKHGILPWMKLGGAVLIATSRPDQFDKILSRIDTRGLTLLPVVTSEAQIKDEITRLYGAELAQRAAVRVPPIESCRTWRVHSPNRKVWAAAILALLGTFCMVAPAWTFTALVLWALTTGFMSVTLRAIAFAAQLTRPDRVPPVRSPANQSRSSRPKVSVLVPLLREKEIATALIVRLARLTYPKSLLQIVLVLEEADEVTRETIASTTLPDWFDVVVVPAANRLTTKPRALNYALDFCKGSIIGVWDAEDAPEVDQIDRIVQHFDSADENVACVQGVLDYYNARTNWLSRCFTIEYAAWWRVVLPGIARLGLIIPLGGTTLFFRRDILEKLGGWDAHNVTEDADLGVRLARHGYVTDLLPTVTYEEANFRPWPWVKQRSRWLKGFLITWCVHMRNPARLIREVGFARFLGIQTLFLACFSQFIFAPVLWSFCIALAGLPHPVSATLGAEWVKLLFFFFLGVEILNAAIAVTAVSGPRHRHLLCWTITMPIYFIFGTFAAYKALFEFVVSPFYWDKTAHGVTSTETSAIQGAQVGPVP